MTPDTEVTPITTLTGALTEVGLAKLLFGGGFRSWSKLEERYPYETEEDPGHEVVKHYSYIALNKDNLPHSIESHIQRLLRKLNVETAETITNGSGLIVRIPLHEYMLRVKPYLMENGPGGMIEQLTKPEKIQDEQLKVLAQARLKEILCGKLLQNAELWISLPNGLNFNHRLIFKVHPQPTATEVMTAIQNIFAKNNIASEGVSAIKIDGEPHDWRINVMIPPEQAASFAHRLKNHDPSLHANAIAGDSVRAVNFRH